MNFSAGHAGTFSLCIFGVCFGIRLEKADKRLTSEQWPVMLSFNDFKIDAPFNLAT